MSPGTLPQTMATNLILSLLLFGAAGTLAWTQAWLFLILFNLGTQATGFGLESTTPNCWPNGVGRRWIVIRTRTTGPLWAVSIF